MDNFTVQAFLMDPSKATDCNNPKCHPAVGGLCAGMPNTDIQWCCKAFFPHCWRTPQLCNFTAPNQLAGQIRCTLPEWPTTGWCCDSVYERCPPASEGVVCIPLYYENPAQHGPAWTPSSGSETGNLADEAVREAPDAVQGTGGTAPAPTEATSKGTRVSVFVALGGGVLVGLGLVAGVGLWWWTRRERAKRAGRRAGRAGRL